MKKIDPSQPMTLGPRTLAQNVIAAMYLTDRTNFTVQDIRAMIEAFRDEKGAVPHENNVKKAIKLVKEDERIKVVKVSSRKIYLQIRAGI